MGGEVSSLHHLLILISIGWKISGCMNHDQRRQTFQQHEKVDDNAILCILLGCLLIVLSSEVYIVPLVQNIVPILIRVSWSNNHINNHHQTKSKFAKVDSEKNGF